MPGAAFLFKLLAAKEQFRTTHPRFLTFLRRLQAQGLAPGSVIELTVTQPDGRRLSTRLRVQPSDAALFRELLALWHSPPG